MILNYISTLKFGKGIIVSLEQLNNFVTAYKTRIEIAKMFSNISTTLLSLKIMKLTENFLQHLTFWTNLLKLFHTNHIYF